MRLIDADALLDAYENIDWYTVHKTGYMTSGSTSSDNPVIHYYDGEEVIKNAPTIDAVPVVRKPVVGYEGYYEVDQFGRVFSVDRVISVDDNGRKYEKPIAGKQMKQSLKNKGYKIVSLTKDGTTKMAYVHRIVAEAFIPNPDNLPMVNHKDEDKTNNFLENLEWCTAKYNCNYGTGIKRHADKIKGRESEKRVAVIQRSIDGVFINRHSSVKRCGCKCKRNDWCYFCCMQWQTENGRRISMGTRLLLLRRTERRC